MGKNTVFAPTSAKIFLTRFMNVLERFWKQFEAILRGLGKGNRARSPEASLIVVHGAYCSTSVVHEACCSVVTVNTSNIVRPLTLRCSTAYGFFNGCF